MKSSSNLCTEKPEEIHGQVKRLSDQVMDFTRTSRASRFKNASFIYDASKDSIYCSQCDFTLERCSQQSNVEALHRESKPNCPAFQRRQTQTNASSTKYYKKHFFKRQRLDTPETDADEEILFKEMNAMKHIRAATFASWNSPSLSKELLEAAGFFYSDVGDRVICLYCNLICQNWSADHDDPIETHCILSPNCTYTLFYLAVKENPSHREMDVDVVEPCDRLSDSEQLSYTYYSDRNESFKTSPHSLANRSRALARAGFFFVRTSQHLKCFYCHLTVDTIDSNTDPLEKHVELSPNCSYAKKRDQILKQARNKERSRLNHQLQHLNIETNLLQRLVNARIDLPASQFLRDCGYSLAMIRRVWENQLRFRGNDFTDDIILYINCEILKRQIEIINGNRDNITIPRSKISQIRRGTNIADLQKTPVPIETNKKTEADNGSSSTTVATKESKAVSITQEAMENKCKLCQTNERQLAAIPCGHLIICRHCSSRCPLCLVCKQRVQAFVRVFC